MKIITELNPAEIAEMTFPVVRDVYTNPNNNFENIVTPFTDGIRAILGNGELEKIILILKDAS